MHSRLLIPALLVLLLAPLGAEPDHVRISTTVTDRQGRPVTGLTLKDFELREDGVVQKLVSVEARKPEPRRLAILLDEFHVDASDSERVRDAVTRFVMEQLRPGETAIVLKPLDPLTSMRLTEDRDALRAAIAGFEGRKGNYEPRSPLEEETMGRAPALVDAGRAQVVLSALRALATQLGSSPGRAAILLVSEGFTRQPRRLTVRGLPDASTVERFANRYDVPIYAFDPRPVAGEPDDSVATLGRFVSETGGTLVSRRRPGRRPHAASARKSTAVTPSRINPRAPTTAVITRSESASCAVKRMRAAAAATCRRRPPRRAARCARVPAPSSPHACFAAVPSSPCGPGSRAYPQPTGESSSPGSRASLTGSGRSTASRVELKATLKDGKMLYEGVLAPVRVGEAADKMSADRAEFDAPSGRVQLDMTILNVHGVKLDVDARDVEVPALKNNTSLLLPAILIATQSAREFRDVAADLNAAPDPSRQFRRTDRLVIRVPAYSGDTPAPVTALLLNRLAQPMREIGTLPGADPGVTQFDLPLAPLAPGEYSCSSTSRARWAPSVSASSFELPGEWTKIHNAATPQLPINSQTSNSQNSQNSQVETCGLGVVSWALIGNCGVVSLCS